MKPQPPDAGINPASAQTKAEFGAALKGLMDEAHLGVRQIEESTKGTKSQMSSSSISGWHTGKSLPTPENLDSYLRFLGLPGSEIEVWQKVRNGISSGERRAKPAGPEIDRTLGELAAGRVEIDTLKAREVSLRSALDVEQCKRREAENQLEEVLSELATAQLSAKVIQEHLRNDIAEYWRRLEESNKKVGALEHQLGQTEGKRQQAEAEQARLLATLRELEVASSEIEDLHNLEFKRAEFERRRREEAEKKLVHRDEEISTLRRMIGEYQHQINGEAKVHRELEPTSVTSAQNTNINIRLVVRDADFGRQHALGIGYKWFCKKCNRGGQMALSACPRCGCRILRNHTFRILVDLPDKSSYDDEPLRCEGLGNYDEIDYPPGDLYVEVVRR